MTHSKVILCLCPGISQQRYWNGTLALCALEFLWNDLHWSARDKVCLSAFWEPEGKVGDVSIEIKDGVSRKGRKRDGASVYRSKYKKPSLMYCEWIVLVFLWCCSSSHIAWWALGGRWGGVCQDTALHGDRM